MSTLNVDKVDPSTGTALEIGSSGDTITVPSGATFAVSGTMNASSITAGTVATARLGTGTASSSTVLYGDQTYKAEPGGGITAASQWRLTTSFTGDLSPINANWEEVDAPVGFGILGSSMTESSGIFTFPSTGYWLIDFSFSAFSDGQGATAYIEGHIYTTTNNSTYAQAANPRLSYAGSTYTNSAFGNYIHDVTDTANDKVAFYITSNAGTIIGSTSYNRTYATFTRLGDT